MAWLALIAAGFLEITWAVALKYAGGFTKFWPSAFVIVCGYLSFWLLGVAIRTIPLGTGYAIWTGIGIVGTAIFGIFFFQESAHFWKLFFIATMLASLVGLRLTA